MWSVKDLYIKNIAAFHEAKYTFNEGVATLVYGENMDNDSQLSNGSGKSAFSEAIAIALLGTPLRNVKQDEIINNDSDSAVVRLTLHNKATDTQMLIERAIFKGTNKPQKIAILLKKDGKESACVKSSVDEYNKSILETLGITKEEIYSSFILCRSRYSDFLMASDRDKKEIINKFSRGNLVDDSIKMLQEDKALAVENQTIAKNCHDSLEMKLEMYTQQIEEAKEYRKQKEEERKATREKALQRLAQIKIELVDNDDRCHEAENRRSDIGERIELLNDFEEANYEGKDLFAVIKYLAEKNYVDGFDFTRYSNADYISQIHAIEQDIEKANLRLVELQKEAESLRTILEEANARHQECLENEAKAKQHFSSATLMYNDERANTKRKISLLQEQIRNHTATINHLIAQAKSAIKCPHCETVFTLHEGILDLEKNDQAIEELKAANIEDENNIQLLHKELETITGKMEALDSYLESAQNDLRKVVDETSKLRLKVNDNVRKTNSEMAAISDLKKRKIYIEGRIDSLLLDLMEDYFKALESEYNSVDTDVKTYKLKRKDILERIQTGENYIKELDNMGIDDSIEKFEKSKSETEELLSESKDRLEEANLNVAKLSEQERHFNAFKTYLANGKIDALSAMTNDFLQHIGSDLRVRFDGYSLLRSGKIRDKISVAVLRDGVEIGSVGKLSVGEMSRLQLAVILSMHKLINLNADDNKGLDLLLVDEVLDGVDESGLSNIIESINRIGITAVIISHGKLAESYRYTLTIRKQNGISKIYEQE